MSKLVGVIASLLLTANVPAGAADMPAFKAAPPVPVYDWNGFYAGASFAYHSGRTHDTFTRGPTVYPINRDMFHGSFGSIEAGYCRMAASPVVLCCEAGNQSGSRARHQLRLHHVGAEHPYPHHPDDRLAGHRRPQARP